MKNKKTAKREALAHSFRGYYHIFLSPPVLGRWKRLPAVFFHYSIPPPVLHVPHRLTTQDSLGLIGVHPGEFIKWTSPPHWIKLVVPHKNVRTSDEGTTITILVPKHLLHRVPFRIWRMILHRSNLRNLFDHQDGNSGRSWFCRFRCENLHTINLFDSLTV